MSTREEIEALGFEVPDSITPIVACRSWAINHAGLVSHNRTLWVPGKAMKAQCAIDPQTTRGYHRNIIEVHGRSKDLNPEDVPMKLCSCGIYAAKHDEANSIVPIIPGCICGEVYMWGKIVEGPNGYRSEFAYPKRFFAITRERKVFIESLGFGVPVILVEGASYRFPFPQEKGRSRSRQKQPLYTPLWGLPAIAVGMWDGLSLDMSRTFNQLLTAGSLLAGILPALSVAHRYLFPRRMRRRRRIR